MHRNPVPTVDVILRDDEGRVLLIRRRNPPPGWALPGGFVDYGETLEAAAVREAREETSLEVELVRQFHTYSDPARDPRLHTVSVVFLARVTGGTLQAADDAADAAFFAPDELPEQMAFDHRSIIEDLVTERY